MAWGRIMSYPGERGSPYDNRRAFPTRRNPWATPLAVTTRSFLESAATPTKIMSDPVRKPRAVIILYLAHFSARPAASPQP
jgi:hypothetical protein